MSTPLWWQRWAKRRVPLSASWAAPLACCVAECAPGGAGRPNARAPSRTACTATGPTAHARAVQRNRPATAWTETVLNNEWGEMANMFPHYVGNVPPVVVSPRIFLISMFDFKKLRKFSRKFQVKKYLKNFVIYHKILKNRQKIFSKKFLRLKINFKKTTKFFEIF